MCIITIKEIKTKSKRRSKVVNYVLIGGGLTSGQTALTLLKSGIQDPITLITNEPYYPYERPGLSKGYLQGKEGEDTLYTDIKTLKKAGNFKIITNTTVKKIDSTKQEIILDNNQILPYDKLLLATGARPRELTINNSHLNPIFYFRNIDDVNAIKTKIKNDNCQNAIIIGASFIGMEVAASLRQLGLAVTILHRGKLTFDKLDSPILSKYFLDYFVDKGVNFVFEDEAESITSTGLITKKGQEIKGDIIIAGVGVVPNIELAKNSGIEVDEKSQGIIVDDQFKTNIKNIWAGGDIAYFPDKISGHSRRIEHWDNANEQGQFIAHQMIGSNEHYNHLAYFFSDVFDLTFEFFGDSSTASDRISIDNWTSQKSFVELYINDNSILVAAFIMNVADNLRDNIINSLENKEKIDQNYINNIK
jgi:NADPH-dependent 2,4-dienoyl-CoA reductase/sulfur reductase-like enzyme